MWVVPREHWLSSRTSGTGVFFRLLEGVVLKELVSPQESQVLVLLLSVFLTLVGASAGWYAAGKRGLAAGLLGPLVAGLWVFHRWITRYDPETGYFGLDKVWVWGVEVILFIALGVALGIGWGRFIAKKSTT